MHAYTDGCSVANRLYANFYRYTYAIAAKAFFLPILFHRHMLFMESLEAYLHQALFFLFILTLIFTFFRSVYVPYTDATSHVFTTANEVCSTGTCSA